MLSVGKINLEKFFFIFFIHRGCLLIEFGCKCSQSCGFLAWLVGSKMSRAFVTAVSIELIHK